MVHVNSNLTLSPTDHTKRDADVLSSATPTLTTKSRPGHRHQALLVPPLYGNPASCSRHADCCLSCLPSSCCGRCTRQLGSETLKFGQAAAAAYICL